MISEQRAKGATVTMKVKTNLKEYFSLLCGCIHSYNEIAESTLSHNEGAWLHEGALVHLASDHAHTHTHGHSDMDYVNYRQFSIISVSDF